MMNTKFPCEAFAVHHVATSGARARPAPAQPQAGDTPDQSGDGDAVTGRSVSDHACYLCHGRVWRGPVRAFVPNWPANLATERSRRLLRGRANVAPVRPSTSMNYPLESVSVRRRRTSTPASGASRAPATPVEKISDLRFWRRLRRDHTSKSQGLLSDTDREGQRYANCAPRRPPSLAPESCRRAVRPAARRRQPDAKPAHV